MLRVKTNRKAILVSLAVAAISYGLKLYAQQQNGQLTPPPKATSSQPSPAPENSNWRLQLVVGERLVYNVAWSSFPSAARVEMEVAAQGRFYGRESYLLRSRVETLGQVRSLFGDIDNQYTSYVSSGDALPHRTVSAIHRGQTRSEEVVVFDHSKQKAIFSDESEVPIHGGTYDLTSLIYWLRLQPLTDGSKYKFTALYGKDLIEVHGVGLGYSCLPCRRIERSGLNPLNQPGAHHDQILEELECTALLWRWAVVELVAVNLACEMQQYPYLVLKGCNEFFLGEYHNLNLSVEIADNRRRLY